MIRKTIDNVLMQTMLARQKIAKKGVEMMRDWRKAPLPQSMSTYAKKLIGKNTNATGHQVGFAVKGEDCDCTPD